MTNRAVDIAVIGGGAFGMWCAIAAAAAGAEVVLLEAGPTVFSGASATPVGALTPFPFARPDDPLAAYQAEALLTMAGAMDRLTAMSGIVTGYIPHGRLTPLRSAADRARAEAQVVEGKRRMPWGPRGRRSDWRISDSYRHSHLFAQDSFSAGWMSDSVSAQIDSAHYAEALEGAAEGLSPRLRLWLGCRISKIERTGPHWRLNASSTTVAARRVILASGWQSGALAAFAGFGAEVLAGPSAGIEAPEAPLRGAAAAADRPVKGQSALLALPHGRLPVYMPVVQAPRLFIVNHTASDPERRADVARIGVGATNEPGETDLGTDHGLDDVVASARALMPVLEEARVERRWAGIRPRPPGKLPRIGEVADAPGLWHASGGFKIGLALAHHAGMGVAAAALGIAPGTMLGPFGPAPALPAAFAPGTLR
ncbi:MAG: FAD-dependent oxidoreductase [Pseudomonadota bacterium]